MAAIAAAVVGIPVACLLGYALIVIGRLGR